MLGTTFKGTTTDDSVGFTCTYPAIDAKGTLYFLDVQNRQVKQLPADQEPP